jgi:hypothetical protein
LDKNDTAYAEYFEWKRYFRVEWDNSAFCYLCKALNENTRPEKVYTDLEEWWVKGSHCRKSYINWLNE